MTLMFRKDVRLPVHLQRAMAAEAEAAREARAKVSELFNGRYSSLIKTLHPHPTAQRLNYSISSVCLFTFPQK